MDCKAVNKSGKPCGAQAVGNSEFCFWHSPAHTAKAARAQQKGGHHKRVPRSGAEFPGGLTCISDVVNWLNVLLADEWQLEPSDRRTRSILSTLRLGVEALQVSDLERRLSDLEELVIELKNPD